MKNRFRIPAILLVLFLCLNLLPFGAFADGPYSITVSISPAGGGTVSGDGSYAENETVTLTATPDSNHYFVNWTEIVGEETQQVSTNAMITFPAVEDRSLIANFEVIPTHAVTVTNGSGGGTYKEEAPVTITADTAPAGQRFSGWSGADGLTFTSGSAATTPATFTMPHQDVSVTAEYEVIPRHAVTVTNGSGGGTYEEEAPVTITADSALAGQRFSGWSGADGLTFTSGSAATTPATFNMPHQDVSVTATYEVIPTHAVTVTNGSGGGTYEEEAPVTITADTAPAGQRFSGWSGADGLTFTSGSAATTPATFTMPNHDVTVAAAYEDIPPATQHTVSVSANPAAGGTVSGGGTYDDGAGATLTATAAANYQFVNWTEGETVASTNASYSFTVTADRTLTANFVMTYLVDVKTSTHGTVTADAARAPEGATVNLTITPETGFELDSILVQKVNDEPVSISNNTFVMPNCNVTVTATFKAAVPISYTVTGGANGGWVKYSGLPYTFTVKRNIADEDTAGLFMGIYIDSYILPINEYTVKAGSVIITIIPAAMQRLSPGWHTFTFVFRDGTAATRVYIWGNSWYPATGDERDTAAWAVLAGVTLVGMGVIAALGCMYWKKQKNKGKD